MSNGAREAVIFIGIFGGLGLLIFLMIEIPAVIGRRKYAQLQDAARAFANENGFTFEENRPDLVHTYWHLPFGLAAANWNMERGAFTTNAIGGKTTTGRPFLAFRFKATGYHGSDFIEQVVVVQLTGTLPRMFIGQPTDQKVPAFFDAGGDADTAHFDKLFRVTYDDAESAHRILDTRAAAALIETKATDKKLEAVFTDGAHFGYVTDGEFDYATLPQLLDRVDSLAASITHM
jgi:hypothetical protein